MSDAPTSQEQTTLEDVDANTQTNESEAAEEPKIRKKRALIDVPSRSNIGADGSESDEFK